LFEHTKKAVCFAEALGCPNIVFGCPRNRNIPENIDKNEALKTAEMFFGELAVFALEHGTVIALEANPPVYDTNFLTTTKETVDFCRRLNRHGLKVNIDLGTMIYYNESVNIIAENTDIISHIHISEPGLVPITKRRIHKELKNTGINVYFSIEMKNTGAVETVKNAAQYAAEVFL
jgi:sugar phosphate isomerase/epimerase